MAHSGQEERKHRSFLALPLNPEFLAELSGYLNPLRRKISGVKWVNPEQIHVTLHFFGAISDGEIASVRTIVRHASSRWPPLCLALHEIGFFPHIDRAHIIWLDLDGDANLLCGLQQQMEAQLRSGGFPTEDRFFRVHATIGRIKSHVAAGDLRILPALKTGIKTINRIVLYESHLSSEGPRHEILETFPLSGVKGA